MKIYKVKVNGKVYEVELESVSEAQGTIAVAQNAAPQAPAAPAAAGDQEVKAPMAGTILDVKVAVGAQVKKGQVIAILEAMKLENEVVSTAEGTVKQVLVNKGQAVTNQQVLVIVG
jgi:biotin carboxyl carrier protein